MSRVVQPVPLLLSLLLTACASTPFPGDERIDDGPSFDATSPMPQAQEPATGGRRANSPAGDKRRKSLAETYKEPARGPSAQVLLERHYQKCRPSSAPSNVVIPGQIVLEVPDRRLLGPYELTLEPGGRFRETMTLAASSDEHDYGQGVERERGFDGKTAWRKEARAGAYFVDEVERELFAIDARLFLGRWAEVFPKLETVGETQFAGFPAHELRGRTAAGEVFALYLHRDTSFLLGRAHIDAEGEEGPLSTVTFFELSTHAGLCVPKRIEAKNGEEKQTITLADPRIGRAVKPIAPPAELRDIGGLEAE